MPSKFIFTHLFLVCNFYFLVPSHFLSFISACLLVMSCCKIVKNWVDFENFKIWSETFKQFVPKLSRVERERKYQTRRWKPYVGTVLGLLLHIYSSNGIGSVHFVMFQMNQAVVGLFCVVLFLSALSNIATRNNIFLAVFCLLSSLFPNLLYSIDLIHISEKVYQSDLVADMDYGYVQYLTEYCNSFYIISENSDHLHDNFPILIECLRLTQKYCLLTCQVVAFTKLGKCFKDIDGAIYFLNFLFSLIFARVFLLNFEVQSDISQLLTSVSSVTSLWFCLVVLFKHWKVFVHVVSLSLTLVLIYILFGLNLLLSLVATGCVVRYTTTKYFKYDTILAERISILAILTILIVDPFANILGKADSVDKPVLSWKNFDETCLLDSNLHTKIDCLKLDGVEISNWAGTVHAVELIHVHNWPREILSSLPIRHRLKEKIACGIGRDDVLCYEVSPIKCAFLSGFSGFERHCSLESYDQISYKAEVAMSAKVKSGFWDTDQQAPKMVNVKLGPKFKSCLKHFKPNKSISFDGILRVKVTDNGEYFHVEATRIKLDGCPGLDSMDSFVDSFGYLAMLGDYFSDLYAQKNLF